MGTVFAIVAIVVAGVIVWGTLDHVIREALDNRRRTKEYDTTMEELNGARVSVAILDDGGMEIASYGRRVAGVYNNEDTQRELEKLGVSVSEDEAEDFYHAARRNVPYHGIVVAR